MDPHAERWFAAWNARDADAIMALYADNVAFHSPFVTRLGLSDTGQLQGKSALDGYVRMALPRLRNLKFDPIGVCEGIADHTLVYRNQSGHIVAERHQYDTDGLICLASAAYSTSPLKRA
jgi:hypothetical protein